MHSKVYQLVENYNEEAFDLDYFEWFCPGIADYYSECESNIEDIAECLSTVFGTKISNSNNGIMFTITKEKVTELMKSIYQDVKRNYENLKSSLDTYESFKKEYDFAQYLLTTSYNDKFSFYIIYEGELYTLNEFIRKLDRDFSSCSENENPSRIFYIKTIYDYHY